MAGNYLVQNAILECNCSVTKSKLKLPEGSGVMVQGDMTATQADCVPGKNFQNFCQCNSGLWSGKPCEPQIIGEWLCADKGTKLNGKAVITTDSVLFCQKGGVIFPKTTGQSPVKNLFLRMAPWDLYMMLADKTILGYFSNDPVHLSTGNLVFSKEDLKVSGAFPLVFRRMYSAIPHKSQNRNARKPMGIRWSHSYECSLTEDGQEVRIWYEDGYEKTFRRNGGFYQPPPGCGDGLVKRRETFELTSGKGPKRVFDLSGKLLYKADRWSNRTEFTYEGNLLSSVRTACGGLTFCYGETGLLTEVGDTGGRRVRYGYDTEGRLIEVADPLGCLYRYQYDEQGRLTEEIDPIGITGVSHEPDEIGRTVRQTFPDGGAVTYEYDDDIGRVVMTEQNRNRVKYYRDERYRNIRTVYRDGYEETDYNDQNRIIRFQDKNKNETFFEYDVQSQMTKTINALSEETGFQYNSHGQLTKLCYSDGSAAESHYRDDGLLSALTDTIGRVTKIEYTARGLVKAIICPDGSKAEYEYDSRFRLCKIKNPAGMVTLYEYDAYGRVTASEDGRGNRNQFFYNDRDDIIKVINPEGNERSYEYDGNGKVVQITDFDGSVQRMEYNELGKVSKTIDPDGRITEYKYDIMWNLAEIIDGKGGKLRYRYNRLNRLEELTDKEGRSVTYQYDPNGNCISYCAMDGVETKITYDCLNRKQVIETPDGKKSRFTYDIRGRLTVITDPAGNRKEMKYDSAGQLVEEKDALGNHTSYRYNLLGQVEAVEDPVGRVLWKEYFPGGRLKKIIRPDGNSTEYEYDEAGLLVKETEATGYWVEYIRDSLYRVTQTRDSAGVTHTYQYDALGRLLYATDGNGNRTGYRYSPGGVLIETEDTLGGKVCYQYDLAGYLAETIHKGETQEPGKEEGIGLFDGENHWSPIGKEPWIATGTEPKEHKTLYKRNQAGQIIEIWDAFGRAEYYDYDIMGRLSRKRDRDGRETGYTYTLGGQLNEILYVDGQTVKMSYNELNQLTEIRDWLGSIRFELDSLGRPWKITDHRGRETGYEWGKCGEQRSITYPDGKKVEYTYDEALRLTGLSSGNQKITYQYDPYSRLLHKECGKLVYSDYAYNERGQLIRMAQGGRDGLLEQYCYNYDGAGNKTEVDRYRYRLEGESGKFRYDYDPLNRLTQVRQDGRLLREYGYDNFGNRVYQIKGENRTDYIYNELNQLTEEILEEAKREYRYDRSGSLLSLTENGKVREEYCYNAMNLPAQVTLDGTKKITYTYDSLGNCAVRRSIRPWSVSLTAPAEEETQYTLDYTRTAFNLLMTEEQTFSLASLAPSETTIREAPLKAQIYLWDNGIVGIESGGGFHYYLRDEQESPVRLMGEGGRPDISFGYDEFGVEKELHQGIEIDQPFGYTGYLKGEREGQYRTPSRPYDAGLGRFLSKDGDEYIFHGHNQSFNQYAYCYGNPLKYIDPLGHSAERNIYDLYWSTLPYAQRWWQNDNLMREAIQMLKYETEAQGLIDLNKMHLWYGFLKPDRVDSRLYAIQELIGMERNGLVYNTSNELNVLLLDHAMETGEILDMNGFLTTSHISLLESNWENTRNDFYEDALLNAWENWGKDLVMAAIFTASIVTVTPYDPGAAGGSSVLVPRPNVPRPNVPRLGGPVVGAYPMLPGESGAGSIHLNIKPTVENPKMQNIIDDIYKGQGGTNTVGNGTTMDAVRNELKTGLPTNGKFHSIKAQELVNRLQRRLRAGDLSDSEIAIANELIKDLQNALSGN